MKIQSLSVVVPAKKCVNDCMFCVSKMHISEYETMITDSNLYYDLYKKDFINRLHFARDNGCNTAMLTGDCEPLQNRSFLAKFGDFNQALPNPFKVIEIQTVGNLITDDYLYFLRHHVGVATISLSVSNIWNYEKNAEIIGCDMFNLETLCASIKKYRFNLRLSLNMTDHMIDGHTVSDIFDMCSLLGADQITFRAMYLTSDDTPENIWLHEHRLSDKFWYNLKDYITKKGRPIDKLEYGRTKYSVNDIGVVVDDDCMSVSSTDVAKYLILRPDCKLYSKWETKASLIF